MRANTSAADGRFVLSFQLTSSRVSAELVSEDSRTFGRGDLDLVSDVNFFDDYTGEIADAIEAP